MTEAVHSAFSPAAATPSTSEPTDAALAQFLTSLPKGELIADYKEYNELFFRKSMLPEHLVSKYVAEAEALRSKVVRKRVPGYKKSGSVSYYELRESAPSIMALYESPELIALLSEITGEKLMTCPEDDPHSAALYYYTEAGDGIGWHYDTSHYAGNRYTILVGLVNKTTQAELICQPYKKLGKGREPLELKISTDAGTFICFNGNNIYHCVSQLGENEERIVLTLEYVTNRHMNPFSRFISNMKDALTYFGIKGLFRRPGAAVASDTSSPKAPTNS